VLSGTLVVLGLLEPAVTAKPGRASSYNDRKFVPRRSSTQMLSDCHRAAHTAMFSFRGVENAAENPRKMIEWPGYSSPTGRSVKSTSRRCPQAWIP